MSHSGSSTSTELACQERRVLSITLQCLKAPAPGAPVLTFV